MRKGRGFFRRPRRARSRLVAAGSLLLAIGGVFGAGTTPAGAAPAAPASAACPWVGSVAPVSQRVSQLLAAMSQSQKLSLVSGVGSSYVGSTPGIPSLCIPALNLEDGPAGVADGMTGVTQLPAPVSAAATWDTAAEQQYGAVIGGEQAGKGTSVDLGPTVNMVRDPRWGRAFEANGEDPYLAGALGAAQIRGIQGQGVMAQVKHLAVYNQETNRNTSSDNAIVDDRTMQELYLPAFQAATKSAVSSVMCAYSVVNGTPACQNPYLMNTVLDQQFGFPGFTTSDWGGTHSTVASANAGLDMEMPSPVYYGSALQSAVNAGQVSGGTLDTMVSRILGEMFTFGMFDKAATGSPAATVTTAAHAATGQQIAEQGTVLLKNAGGQLPLSTAAQKTVAVLGADASTSPQTAGGGSASVKASSAVTPLQGITARAGSGVAVSYAPGDTSANIAQAVNLARNADVAVVFASMNESEGGDLSSIDLPGNQNQLIEQVAAANPHTVVVLNTGSAVTMPWLSSVSGVLEDWYPGQSDGTAIARLLYGDVDPNGKLPVSFPKSLSDVPAHTAAQWPGQNGQVQYSEGLDMGYRWYQAKDIAPLFPFGFGLSYTTFAFSGLSVSPLDAHGTATVKATVTNTGTKEGSEVAQMYVGDPASTGEPPEQLKGFQKVDLQPGASTQVSFPVTLHDLATWSDSANAWTTATGSYRVYVGDTSASPQLSGSLNVTSTSAGNTVTVPQPAGMSSPVGTAASLPVTAKDSDAGQTLTYTAAGLPAGLSVNASTGTVSGTTSGVGTSTVTVTATDSTGASGSTSFVWSSTPALGSSGAPGTAVSSGVSPSLCLDVRSASNANGTPVQIYTCNGTAAQQWSIGTDGTVRSLGKCLDVIAAGTANNTKVDLYDCNGTGAQVWQHRQDGTLYNPESGRCLDDPAASTTAGTQLGIYDCNGTNAQRWTTAS